jgi:ABC-type branched-subunit amino acid transport system substrate-binding protein
MGQAMRNGITLFTERQPADAAKVKFIYEDSKYDGKEAITIARKLSEVDKARLLVVWGNTPANAAAPVIKAMQVRGAFISHDDHSRENPDAIDIGPSSSACLAPLAAKVRQVGVEKFGTIGIDVGSVVPWLDSLDREIGTKLFRELVSSDATQFQSQLLKGKSRGISTYLLAMMPDQGLLLARQAKQLNLTPSFVGIDAFANDKILAEIKGVQPDLGLVSGGVQPWFKEAYRQRFGDGAFLLEAASGYVLGQLASQLAREDSAHKTFADAIKGFDIATTPYKDAQISGPGVRISAPCGIETAEAYLGSTSTP